MKTNIRNQPLFHYPQARFLACACLGFIVFISGARDTWAQSADADIVRFLDQSTFGPTPDLIDRVRQVGFEAFLNEQFNMPLPDYPNFGYWPQNPATDCTGTCVRDNYTMYPLQARFFQRALTGPDQLRQRVAFALNQILVVSAADANLRLPSRMLPYLKVLDQNAFGNFRQLLEDITLNPGMGRYLDSVGNNKANPNENYGREILQLFSIGVDELNPDGTPKLDSQGNRIPTYDQDTVTNFARVFTGWVFANQPQQGIVNYFDPMTLGAASAHDTNPKQVLNGVTLPAGQNARTDLTSALDNIFAHENVGPFISKNLIQHLVTGNPSPAYVGRVAAVFNGVGNNGLRGDMRAVVKAILLDPEARNGASPWWFDPKFGHLSEPVLWITSLLRAFNTTGATTDFVLSDRYLPADIRMDQDLYYSPTVFNFFPPEYVIPGETLLGPEFAIQSTTTSLARTNFAWEAVYHTMPTSADRPTGSWLDLSSIEPLAGTAQQLVDALNMRMLHGTMSAARRNVIINAVQSIPESNKTARAREAVYLTATSSQYLVQR